MLCGQKLTCYYKKGNREQKLEINSPFLKEKKYVYNYLYTYYMYMEGMKSKMSRNFTSSRRIETFLVLFFVPSKAFRLCVCKRLSHHKYMIFAEFVFPSI